MLRASKALTTLPLSERAANPAALARPETDQLRAVAPIIDRPSLAEPPPGVVAEREHV
jgi:hypothetical protein